MIKFSFTLPVFDHRIVYLQTKSPKPAELSEFRSFYRKHFKDVPDSTIMECVTDPTGSGAWTAYDSMQRTGAIIIYNTYTLPDLMNLLHHEKRHLEDYILKNMSIRDGETAGNLAGFLGEKLVRKVLALNGYLKKKQ